MNQIKQQPEITPMQNLIEWINRRQKLSINDIIKKASELGDTVEKEQHKRTFSNGHKMGYQRGTEDAAQMLSHFTNYDQIEKDYNEKYGTDINNGDKQFKCVACRDTGCSLTSETLQNCTSCGMFERGDHVPKPVEKVITLLHTQLSKTDYTSDYNRGRTDALHQLRNDIIEFVLSPEEIVCLKLFPKK